MFVIYNVIMMIIYECIIIYFTGMNKMVINNLEKLLVTNDAATILRELEVSSDDVN